MKHLKTVQTKATKIGNAAANVTKQSASALGKQINKTNLATDNVKLPPATQHIRVKIIAAKNLPGVDNGGETADPYVCLEMIGMPRQRTHVVFETLTPLWNKTFYIPIRDMPQVLLFSVKDDNFIEDDVLLGYNQFDLPTLVENKEKQMWLPLETVFKAKGPPPALLVSMYYDTKKGCSDLQKTTTFGKALRLFARKLGQMTSRLFRLVIGVIMDVIIFSCRLLLHHLERRGWSGSAVIVIEALVVEIEFEISTNDENNEKELERRLGKLAKDLDFNLTKRSPTRAEDIAEEVKDMKMKDKSESNAQKLFNAAKKLCYKLVDMLLFVVKEACLHFQKRDAHAVMKILAILGHELPLVGEFLIRYGISVDSDTVKRDDVLVEDLNPYAFAPLEMGTGEQKGTCEYYEKGYIGPKISFQDSIRLCFDPPPPNAFKVQMPPATVGPPPNMPPFYNAKGAPPPATGYPPQQGYSGAPAYGQAPPPVYGQAPPPAYGQAPPPAYGQAPPPAYGQAPPPAYGSPGGGQARSVGGGGGGNGMWALSLTVTYNHAPMGTVNVTIDPKRTAGDAVAAALPAIHTLPNCQYAGPAGTHLVLHDRATNSYITLAPADVVGDIMELEEAKLKLVIILV